MTWAIASGGSQEPKPMDGNNTAQHIQTHIHTHALPPDWFITHSPGSIPSAFVNRLKPHASGLNCSHIHPRWFSSLLSVSTKYSNDPLSRRGSGASAFLTPGISSSCSGTYTYTKDGCRSFRGPVRGRRPKVSVSAPLLMLGLTKGRSRVGWLRRISSSVGDSSMSVAIAVVVPFWALAKTRSSAGVDRRLKRPCLGLARWPSAAAAAAGACVGV
mmetsp:Transcript_21372/g.52299  ORF Transcript_21372/g.52299 Transcript_21372/m.52299 type:complete len:215 (+) Transcript_21372:860-1504(+)